jgi:hypothetical protein
MRRCAGRISDRPHPFSRGPGFGIHLVRENRGVSRTAQVLLEPLSILPRAGDDLAAHPERSYRYA